MLIDLETHEVRYLIRKRVGNDQRVREQRGFADVLAGGSLRRNYFAAESKAREPFALLHAHA